ncbi:MAG: response regulator [Chitinophagaceae bacterium]
MDRLDILLVEDSSSDAELTIYALRKNKLVNNLLHLEDGAQALDFLFGRASYIERNIEVMPAVILLDLKMPRINGLELLQAVKADNRTRNIPVIILTSSREDPDIKKAYDLGANSYVVKPVVFENFQKAIADIGYYWMFLNQKP